MKKLAILTFSLLCASLLLTAQGQRRAKRTPQRKVDSPIDTVKLIYPKATDILPINTVWNKVIDAKGNLLGYVFNSQEYGVDNLGYYEDVPVLVVTDKAEKIQSVSIINSLETPSYVRDVYSSGFMQKWNGKKIKELNSVEVDAVSGATFTTEAVIQNMKLISTKAIENQPK